LVCCTKKNMATLAWRASQVLKIVKLFVDFWLTGWRIILKRHAMYVGSVYVETNSCSCQSTDQGCQIVYLHIKYRFG
jgi:hypothetical protein